MARPIDQLLSQSSPEQAPDQRTIALSLVEIDAGTRGLIDALNQENPTIIATAEAQEAAERMAKLRQTQGAAAANLAVVSEAPAPEVIPEPEATLTYLSDRRARIEAASQAAQRAHDQRAAGTEG